MAAVAKGAKATDPVSINSIQVETVRKEMRNYHLYDTYVVSPNLHKNIFLCEKPQNTNFWDRTAKVGSQKAVDEDFQKSVERATKTPREKYELPLLESHKIGWDTKQLLPENLTDPRFYHPRRETAITKLFRYVTDKKEEKKGGA